MGAKKMRKLRGLFAVVLLFLGLSSCNSYLAGGLRVAWGRQLLEQGNYQEALLYFFEAQQSLAANGKTSGLFRATKSSARRRIGYNIGLIYSALGQNRAAIRQWQQILNRGGLDQDEALRFALFYNIGLLYSKADENAAARRYLVQALDLRPKHENARKALELCLLREKSPKLLSEDQQTLAQSPPQPGIGDEQILNYISQEARYHFQRDAPTQKVLRNDW